VWSAIHQELKHVHQACRVSFQIVKAALEQLRRGFGQCKQAISLVSSSVYQDEHDTKFCQVGPPPHSPNRSLFASAVV
jgi:hypothetical protein